MDVTVTYVSASIILLIILIALYRSFYDINRKRKARIQIWTFVCGTLGYALTLCVLYLFCFSESEMAVLASYERYTGCYVMAEFFILVIFIIRSVDIKKLMQEKKIGFIAGTLFMLLISGSTFKIFIPAIVEPDSNGEYVEAALALDKYAGDEEVFILSEDTLLSQLYINYYGDTFRVLIDADDYYNMDYSVESNYDNAVKNVFGYNYLYVKNVNDNFNEAFRELNGSEDFVEGRIYRITDDGGVKRTHPVN